MTQNLDMLVFFLLLAQKFVLLGTLLLGIFFIILLYHSRVE